MDIYAILGDNELKAKTKVEKISGMILDGKIGLTETTRAARAFKDLTKRIALRRLNLRQGSSPN